MLVAQITDIHLGFDPGNPVEFNRKRFDDTLAAVMALDPAPELLLLTGDLADRGDVASYRDLRAAIEQANAGFPILMCLGNHDERGNFLSVFAETETCDGFVQYVRETEAVRFIVLDTLEEGRHGGAFCETRAAWLRARLDEAPDRPTVLVLHHPPFDHGIEWMTTDPREPWVLRLEEAIAGHDQIVGAMSGHIHRAIVTGWAGTAISVCPATAPQIALSLAPIDPAHADGRPMIIADPPGFALHYWNGRSLVTHFQSVTAHPVLARFDGEMQGLVESLMAERPDSPPP